MTSRLWDRKLTLHTFDCAVSDGIATIRKAGYGMNPHGGSSLEGDMQSLVTEKEAVTKLYEMGIPKSWFVAEAKAGRVPCLAMGRKRLYNLVAVLEYLQEQAAKKPNGAIGRAEPPDPNQQTPPFAVATEDAA